jgi:hypothetical protein
MSKQDTRFLLSKVTFKVYQTKEKPYTQGGLKTETHAKWMRISAPILESGIYQKDKLRLVQSTKLLIQYNL